MDRAEEGGVLPDFISSTSITSAGATCGRIRPPFQFYLWMLGQLHAKRLVIYLQMGFTVLALWGFSVAAPVNYNGVGVPGLDFDLNAARPHQPFSEIDPLCSKPRCERSRWIVLSFSYFYLFSVVISLIGVRCVERSLWRYKSVTVNPKFNPALLMLPLLFSILSLGVPLILWSFHNAANWIHIFNDQHNSSTIICIIFAFLLPCAIMIVIFLYVLYGGVLAFIYFFRRYRTACEMMANRRHSNLPATASFSWSFRDQQALLRRLHPLSTSTVRSSVSRPPRRSILGRLSPSDMPTSRKTTDQPTLRNYSNKTEGFNFSFASESSLPKDADITNNLNLSMDSRGDYATLGARSHDSMQMVPPVKRVLESVAEEDSGESTLSIVNH